MSFANPLNDQFNVYIRLVNMLHNFRRLEYKELKKGCSTHWCVWLNCCRLNTPVAQPGTSRADILRHGLSWYLIYVLVMRLMKSYEQEKSISYATLSVRIVDQTYDPSCPVVRLDRRLPFPPCYRLSYGCCNQP